MTRAFIVHLNISDQTDLAGVADDIEEALHADGFDVDHVDVWQSPGGMIVPQATPTTFGSQETVPPPPLFP